MTARKKFAVSFTLSADERTEVYMDEWVQADRLTCAAVANHVKDLEWSGGCQHPAFALFSDRNIKVQAVKVREAGSDDWKSIATAPRDRAVTLGWWDMDTFVQTIGFWSESVNGKPGWTDNSVQSFGYEEVAELEPTVWRDLFPAPARAKTKRKAKSCSRKL